MKYTIERLDDRVEVIIRLDYGQILKLVRKGEGCQITMTKPELPFEFTADPISMVESAFGALVDALEQCDAEKQQVEHDLTEAVIAGGGGRDQ